jgi:hypothetical protein
VEVQRVLSPGLCKGVLKVRSHSATATTLDIFSDACTTAGFSLSALPHEGCSAIGALSLL